MKFRILLLIAAAVFLSTSILAQAKAQTSLAPKGFVNDFAGVLDLRTKLDLEQKLQRISLEHGLEIAVVTVKTTGNISIFDYSLSLAKNWKIGRDTKPSYGLLILAAIEDREYFTQVSRDAEAIYPNSWLDKTQKQILVPEFREANYGLGIKKIVDSYFTKFTGFHEIKSLVLEKKFRIYDPKLLSENSLQAVVVTTSDWDTFRGNAQLFERIDNKSDWIARGEPFPIVVGRNGLAWSEDVSYLLEKRPVVTKREGDGKAPAGVFDLTSAFGSVVKPEFVKLSYTKLEESTECVDDSDSANYNKIVDRFKIGNFDWNSSEKMLAVGPEYDLGIFVAHNSSPPKEKNGSCIFLHIWKDENSGTAGCTAMKREIIESILAWLEPEKKPIFVQMPISEYKTLEKTWKLPNQK